MPLYVAEDEEIDFETILDNGPRVGVSRGVGWHAHWLAIEGMQPPIPENPVFLARKSANSEDEALQDVSEAAAELNGTAVKPLVKHVLSRELQLYYERLTSSILNPPTDAKAETEAPLPEEGAPLSTYADGSSGNLVRDAALASLRGDAGIHQLVPYLIQWIGSNVTHTLRARSQSQTAATSKDDAMAMIQLLHTMLSTLHALLVNPSIFIEPYVSIFHLTSAASTYAFAPVYFAGILLWSRRRGAGGCHGSGPADVLCRATCTCGGPLCGLLPDVEVEDCGYDAASTRGACG